MFELVGFLEAVGGQLRATYDACRKTKCHKSSGIKKGVLRSFSRVGRACTDLCWVAALQKGISTLNTGKSRCKTARNPEKCVGRFDKLINRYKKLIVKYKGNAQRKMAAAQK